MGWESIRRSLTALLSDSRATDQGLNSAFPMRLFQDQDIPVTKVGTQVATLPGVGHDRVGARAGWPGVSILWLAEIASSICNLCLRVTARTVVEADQFLRFSSMLLG